MYSQAHVEQSLKAVERLWIEQYKRDPENYLPPCEPVYHSIPACDEAVAHFQARYDKHEEQFGEKGPPLTFDQDELRWMRNEKALAISDYLYYATRYSYILVNNEVIHYKPHTSQLIVNDIRAQLQDLGWAIMMMILKARQVGITTDSQIAVSQRTFFQPNIIALTGSSEKDKSDIMLEKYRLLYEMLPVWMRPEITRDRSGSFMRFGDLNSQLIVQHGRQMSGIGRGNTPTVVHLSELASFENAEALIDAGLLPAIHEFPEILLIFESTAEGGYNWWRKNWDFSKANYWEGRAQLCPVFIPWFVATELYPTRTWLTQHPVPVDWSPTSGTASHAERAYRAVRVNELLRKHYPENWKMPREQMWFWEIKREEYRAKGELDIFQREFCADDLEAFTASGASVFEVDTLSSYNENTKEPLVVYGFRAQENVIPARLHPQHQDINPNLKPIDMKRYQLVPMRWDGWNSTNVDGRLLVWEWPEIDSEYGCGVDTAEGIGQDRSVIEVIRKGTMERNDAQVAEFASANINSMDLAPILHATGLLFQNGGKQPRMVIEVRWNGELTQLELMKLGWGNFHKWVRYDRKKIDVAKAPRIGWYTNSWSRPMMMDKIVKALRDGSIDINSREFVKEMGSLHQDESMQDARAEYGAHDDRFMSLAMVFFSLHILEFTGRATDISYLRQRNDAVKGSMYRAPRYDDGEEMRPEPIGAGMRLQQAYSAFHPGSRDNGWEED